MKKKLWIFMLTMPSSFDQVSPLFEWVWPQGQNPPPSACVNRSSFDLIWIHHSHSFDLKQKEEYPTREGKKKEIWFLCWPNYWHLFDLCLISLNDIMLFSRPVDHTDFDYGFDQIFYKYCKLNFNPLISGLRPKFFTFVANLNLG